MKKLLLTIALLTAGLCASAQIDGYFQPSGDNIRLTDPDNGIDISMPKHDQNNDQGAPLGSGLLILTAMGAGYTLRKRNK